MGLGDERIYVACGLVLVIVLYESNRHRLNQNDLEMNFGQTNSFAVVVAAVVVVVVAVMNQLAWHQHFLAPVEKQTN